MIIKTKLVTGNFPFNLTSTKIGLRSPVYGPVALLVSSQNGDVLAEVTCPSHCRHTAHECPPAHRLLYLSVGFRPSTTHLNHRATPLPRGDSNAAAEQLRSSVVPRTAQFTTRHFAVPQLAVLPCLSPFISGRTGNIF